MGNVLCSNFRLKFTNLQKDSLPRFGHLWLSRPILNSAHRSCGYGADFKRWRSNLKPKHSHGRNDEIDDTRRASLYVHWPYCERRCSYCNFNKYISRNVDVDRIERCLLKETETLIKLSGIHVIDSVFFGGGTPSLAPPQTLGRILETVARHAYLSKDAEVTIEVNPTSSATSNLSDFKLCGINRLSIGVQSLCDRDLKMLGRDHTADDAVRCIEVGRELFPWNVSVDLIFGRHLQTVEAWRKELEQILPLLHGHLSLYQLTVERGTQLFRQVSDGNYIIPSEDELCDMYTLAVELLQTHGLYRYEVSNFAVHGCESDHNRSYWEGKQYIGVGPGAHGRFMPGIDGVTSRQSRVQTLEPDNWMYEVEQRGHGTRKSVDLTPVDRMEELLMTGLRTRSGISHTQWGTLSCKGPSLPELCCSSEQVDHLITEGILVLNDRGLCASSEGLLVLDSVLPHLISSLYQLTRWHRYTVSVLKVFQC